jgi:AcrR family transcriptional regulator
MAAPAGPRTGRRERRRETTRQALMSAALALFREHGYDATTVEQITEAADVSPRTFFHHFRSKEEVLFGGHRQRREELINALRARLESEPVWAATRDAMLTVVDAFEADPSFFRERARLYISEPALRTAVLRINDELVNDVSDVLAEHLATGSVDDTLLPRWIANLANGALRSAIDAWVSEGGRSDLRTRAVAALDAIGPAVEAALANGLGTVTSGGMT